MTKHGKKRKHRCGCTCTATGKIYLVKAGGKLKAMSCKSQANAAYKKCKRTHKSKRACTWTVVRGARFARRRRHK